MPRPWTRANLRHAARDAAVRHESRRHGLRLDRARLLPRARARLAEPRSVGGRRRRSRRGPRRGAPARRTDRGPTAGRRRRPRRRQRPRRPGPRDRGRGATAIAHRREHHVVPARGGPGQPPGGGRPRRVRGRVPAPVRRRFLRRGDQRGGGVPLLLARAVPRGGVPRAATRRRPDDVGRTDPPAPAGSAGGGRGRRDAAGLGSPVRVPPPRRTRSSPRPRPPGSWTSGRRRSATG